MLSSIHNRIVKYNSLNLIFRNTITEVPADLRNGFIEYCDSNKIPHKVSEDSAPQILKKGQSFIVIDDEDLVKLVESAKRQNLKIGEDIGIISYNDAPLKRVVSYGISVISTDFEQMGIGIAKMILCKKKESVRNKTTFINRGSF